MVRRPRSHVLETESIQAFERALPRNWVYRTQVPDYGFDGQAEIFTDKGEQTGLLFFVQLKGTDKKELRNALKVRLPVETCNSYYQAALPILIVLYHAYSGRLFGRWWHTYDPYYGRKRETKTRTFIIQEEDEINGAYFPKLLEDLRAFSILKNPGLPLPIPLRLTCVGQTIQGISIQAFKSSLRSEILDNLSDIFVIKSDDGSARYPEIRVSPKEIVFDLAGLKSMTLHMTNPYIKGRELESLVADTLFIAGFCLWQSGHTVPASRLILRYGAGTTLLEEFNIAFEVAKCLISSRNYRETVRFAKTLLEAGNKTKAQQILKLLLYLEMDNLTQEERREFEELLVSQVKIAEDHGDPFGSALATYNYGKYLSSINARTAFSYYNRARKYDSKYIERSYFIGELGTLAFDLGRYRLAERLYARAIEMHDSRVKRHWGADARMMSGRYREALELYKQCRESSGEVNPIACLAMMSLTALLDETKIEKQVRNPQAARSIIKECKDRDHEKHMHAMRQALKHDLLCQTAWFNLGVSQASMDHNDEALFSFTMAAVVSPSDYGAWFNAMLLLTFPQ